MVPEFVLVVASINGIRSHKQSSSGGVLRPQSSPVVVGPLHRRDVKGLKCGMAMEHLNPVQSFRE